MATYVMDPPTLDSIDILIAKKITYCIPRRDGRLSRNRCIYGNQVSCYPGHTVARPPRQVLTRGGVTALGKAFAQSCPSMSRNIQLPLRKLGREVMVKQSYRALLVP
jgi:hypothetical protein